jgi:hypothetical protein
VIAVAGKYRTGKSFLLNRVIIQTRTGGFGVGPTINPCTKGLWLWPQLIETSYQGQPMKVLIIDSEGIGAFDEDGGSLWDFKGAVFEVDPLQVENSLLRGLVLIDA